MKTSETYVPNMCNDWNTIKPEEKLISAWNSFKNYSIMHIGGISGDMHVDKMWTTVLITCNMYQLPWLTR